MKKIIKAIKNRIDWIMIIMGVFLVSYIFNPRIYRLFPEKIIFATSIALIIWGVLLYKEKRKMK